MYNTEPDVHSGEVKNSTDGYNIADTVLLHSSGGL